VSDPTITTYATDIPPPCKACGMQGAIYTVKITDAGWTDIDVHVNVKCSCCHARSSFFFGEKVGYDPTAADLRRRHEHHVLRARVDELRAHPLGGKWALHDLRVAEAALAQHEAARARGDA
jgi:hypothetical protein